MIFDISRMLNEIKSLCHAYDLFDIKQLSIEWIDNFIKSLNDFIIDKTSTFIAAGDIGNNELQELNIICDGCIKLRKIVYDITKTTIEILNSDVDLISDSIYQGYKHHCDDKNLKLLAFISPIKFDILRKDYAFDDLLISWIYLLNPKLTLGNITGMFLVTKNGFMLLRKDDFENVLKFNRLSQGYRPNYKIVNIPDINELFDV